LTNVLVAVEIARVKLTAQTWVTVLAIYGGGISTLAIFLALRANSLAKKAARDSGPVVIIKPDYDEQNRQLTVSMINRGNTEITFNDLSLTIVHQVITRSGLGRLTVNILTEPIRTIPIEQWWEGYEPNKLPVRLAPRIDFPIRVNSKGIGPLPEEIPPSELILRFVAKRPDDDKYESNDISVHGFTLSHFIGPEPESQAPIGGQPAAS
jgi:hypothetical protein